MDRPSPRPLPPTVPQRPADPGAPVGGGHAAATYVEPSAPEGNVPVLEPVRDADFTCERELGRGGMGAVHVARDHRLRRTVALKVLLADAPTPTELARFVREAQVTGQLAHPHIPPVHELGRTPAGRPFFAMKLVRGRSLRALLDDQRAHPRDDAIFPLSRRLEVLVKTSEAVAFAHGEGVLHRDLKPDNILVGELGEVQVMDWGLAKLLDVAETAAPGDAGHGPLARDTPAITVDGEVAGTPAYMAPEQAAGDVLALDRRTDVFALGAVLYEMLTLEAPYAAPTIYVALDLAREAAWMPVARRIRAAPRPRPPRAPRELAAIAERAMAARPEHRYPDVPAFLADLRAYLAHEPVSAHRDGLVARAAKWTQRRPHVALMLAGVLAVALVSSQLAAARARAVADALLARADRDRALAEAARAELARQAEHERAESLGELAKRNLSAESQAAIAEFHQRWNEAKARGETDEQFWRDLDRTQVARYLDAYDGLYRVYELSSGTPRAQDCFERALLRQATGDPDGAIADYDRALAIQPRFALAFHNRGLARQAKGDPDGAIADYDEALHIDPSFVLALTSRGNARRAKGDQDGAIADYDRALALDPRFVMALNNRGNARLAKGDTDRAIADYDLALAIAPRIAASFYNRGNARKAKGDIDGAIADFDQALAIQPRYADAFHNRGNARKARRDIDGAIADYDQVLAIQPRYAEAYVSRGNARLATGDYDRAIADYDQALAIQPRFARAHHQRGLARMATANTDGAIADYDQALTIEPRYIEALVNRGNARQARGDTDGAIADYDHALAVEPGFWRAAANRGLLFARCGRTPESIASLQLAWRHCGEPAERENIAALIRRLGGTPGD